MINLYTVAWVPSPGEIYSTDDVKRAGGYLVQFYTDQAHKALGVADRLNRESQVNTGRYIKVFVK